MRPRHVHPSVFLFLILPFGAMSGFLTVSLVWVLTTKAGVSLGAAAALVSLSFFPHTWKFLWAPVIDLTLTRKRWYLIASLISAAGIFAMGALPSSKSLGLLSAVTLVANVAVTFLGMSVDSLMAYATAENEKGRAGGWFQAGNLGGSGLGGGAGLWMTQHLAHPWIAGAVLAVACLLCALALPFVVEPPPTIHRQGGPVRAVIEVSRDVWSVVRRRRGFLALLICFLPIGTGAASQLWSGVAGDWHASADTVALVTGTISGVLSMVGCLMGGWLSDRMNRKGSYALYGLLQAGCVVAMAFAPRTESMYILYTSVYAVISGMTYAGFTAVTLEAIGTGAAATKYNVYASLSNQPIAYMTRVDAWGHTRWGSNGFLLIEAVFCAIGVAVFGAVAGVMSRMRPEAEAELPPPSA
jgi:MFS family permease